MPSFVSPAIDHNLYNPILPQDNVMQIFGLLNQKQQYYDQGVKTAQNKISSALNLSSEVTSDPVKNMVTDFNKKANEVIKQNSNLDFSLQNNVKLIDGIYDPLLNNKTFLQDYSATKNWKKETERALSYRDSDKADVRDMYSSTNLELLNIKRQKLAGAKTEREVQSYSNELANTEYTPYHNVKGEIMDYVEKNKDMFKITSDAITGGYVIKSVNGDQAYPSFNAFVHSFLSDKAKNQLHIEQEVGFHNEYQYSGLSKQEFLNQRMGAVKNSYEAGLKESQDLYAKMIADISSYPDAKKLNTAQKKELEVKHAQAEMLEGTVKQRTQNLSNFSNYMSRAATGEIELSRFYDAAENLYTANGVEQEIQGMAHSLARMGMSQTTSKDETYFSQLSENRLSTELNHKMNMDKLNYNIALKKLELDEQGVGIEAYKAGIAFYNAQTKRFQLGDPSLGAPPPSYLEPNPDGPAETTPVDLKGIKNEFSVIAKKQEEMTRSTVQEIVEKLAVANGSTQSITAEDNKVLKNILSEPNYVTQKTLVAKYGADALKKFGLYVDKSTNPKADNTPLWLHLTSSIIPNAEKFVHNSTKDQVGGKAGLYIDLQNALNNHQTNSDGFIRDKKNLLTDVKNSLEAFEKANPKFKGQLTVADNGEIVAKAYSPTSKEALTGTVTGLGLMGAAYAAGVPGTNLPISQIGAAGWNMASSATSDKSPAVNSFNNFLKTKEGAIGGVGSYMQEVLASDAGTFDWLKNNKQLINARTYHITPEQYAKKYDEQYTPFNTNGTMINAHNQMMDRYLDNIDDAGFTLSNKNETVYGRKVIKRDGEIIVYPNMNYISYLYGQTNREGVAVGTPADLPDGYKEAFENIAKNGIHIKTESSVDKSSMGIQKFLNSGNAIPINVKQAGTEANFKLQKSGTKGYVLEGKFADENNFFLDKNLSYKIGQDANGKLSILPTSDDHRYSFFQIGDLLPNTMSNSAIQSYKAIATSQITFNNIKDNPIFVEKLAKYLETTKQDINDIPGYLIEQILSQ